MAQICLPKIKTRNIFLSFIDKKIKNLKSKIFSPKLDVWNKVQNKHNFTKLITTKIVDLKIAQICLPKRLKKSKIFYLLITNIITSI